MNMKMILYLQPGVCKVPRALGDTLMLKYGDHYGQTVVSTEVQQQNTARV